MPKGFDYDAALARAANPVPPTEEQWRVMDTIPTPETDLSIAELDPANAAQHLKQANEGQQGMPDPKDDGTEAELVETFEKAFEKKRKKTDA